MPYSGMRATVVIPPAAPADGRYVGLQPPDLSTATGRTIPSLVFGPEAADLATLVLSEPTRVTLRTFPEERHVEVTAGTVDGERVLEVHFSELVRASIPPTEWRI